MKGELFTNKKRPKNTRKINPFITREVTNAERELPEEVLLEDEDDDMMLLSRSRSRSRSRTKLTEWKMTLAKHQRGN